MTSKPASSFSRSRPGGDRGNVLTFSPDGTKLFTGFYRGTAIVWDVCRGGAASRPKEY